MMHELNIMHYIDGKGEGESVEAKGRREYARARESE